MEVYETWQNIKEKYPRLAVGLGNFDGVHLGHQKLIRELVAAAKKRQGHSLVFTFHPHPTAVLDPKNAPPLLLTREAKEEMIARLGVDVLLRVPFTPEFARTAPEDFIAGVLVAGLGVRVVLVGYNYTFGYQGKGTVALLKEYGERYNYDLHVIPPVVIDGQVVSSTLIRQLVKDGEVAEAAKFLGYFPFVEGVVVAGEKRGTMLGFPTANLEPDAHVLIPANGVYSVRVPVNGDAFLGVANVGVRPTFYGRNSRRNIEVHLLDFQGDLYGKSIQVHFIRRLRGEKRFASPQDLVAQIKQDILKARGIT
ncbi:MAG: bifunctional riboflavin kinase/FAD synthetase [Bacillota bacterium]